MIKIKLASKNRPNILLMLLKTVGVDVGLLLKTNY